ncbi:MAG: ABC transporter substrate-binding protein [Notoacmeibacter sp.]|nr:ABC transporter substrate-binding protein [Notoacmeibacter sp.]
MKRIFRHTKMLAAGAALLALGTASASSGEIRFTLGEYSANTKKSFDGIVEAFEAQNPDIDVTIEVIPWSNYLQALTTDISGGNAPDMSVVASIWLSEFTSQGLVEPIENVVSPDLVGKFIPAMLTPSYIDGKLMGLPIAASARAMMINTELYAKAGATPPENWDQLEAASASIAKMPDVFGFGLPGKEEEVDVYFYYALWSFGGQIFDQEGRSAIASPEGIAAAKLYADLVHSGSTEPTPTAYSREDVFNMFKQGKIGTIFTFPMLVPQIKEEAPDLKYSVMPFPVKAEKSTMAITDSVMVFETSDAKEDVRKFMDFIFQHDFRLEFNKADGLLPVIKSVVEDPYYQENQDIKAFADGLAYAKFQPNVERWDEIIEITRSALQHIYLGDQTPEQALSDAATKIDKLRGF